jgi:predicted O-methyltransferase YrrM
MTVTDLMTDQPNRPFQNEPLFVDSVIDRGWVGEESINRRTIGGAISKDEAQALTTLIAKFDCKKSFETGVAHGISTLAMTQAIAKNQGHHYGIDPCQYNEHQGVALSLLKEHDLASHFTLCEGPAHLELPKLIEAGETFDFAFIDGMHKFDYKFVDFFLSDKLIKVGGLIAFHDIVLPSTKKILRLINHSYDYREIPTAYASPGLGKKAKYTVAAFIKRKPYWYYWPNGFRNLIVLQKVSDVDHPWNYYRNF